MVDLEGNSRPIEEIQVGEMVLARNEFEPNGPLELKRVEELFTRTSPIIELEIGGHKIGTTDEHPFYVPAREAFVPARELKVGDQLISHDGRLMAIDAVRVTGQIAKVYNLRVADYHTYFVGCDEWGWSVWAHNACLTPAQKQSIANDYQVWRTANPKLRSREFFRQVTHPTDGSRLGSGQIKSIKQLANYDTNWTRPGRQSGPQVPASPLVDQRQNLKIAEITEQLRKLGHEIKHGGRKIDPVSGKPLKVSSEQKLPGVARVPDISARGPVGPHGPVPVGTTGPGIVVRDYHYNVGPNLSARFGGGPTTYEQQALDAIQKAGELVFYAGYGQRNRF